MVCNVVTTTAKVRLTDFGKKVYEEHQKQLQEESHILLDPSARDEKNGWSHFPLWELMHIFGPCITPAFVQMPFEGNEIKFDVE